MQLAHTFPSIPLKEAGALRHRGKPSWRWGSRYSRNLESARDRGYVNFPHIQVLYFAQFCYYQILFFPVRTGIWKKRSVRWQPLFMLRDTFSTGLSALGATWNNKIIAGQEYTFNHILRTYFAQIISNLCLFFVWKASILCADFTFLYKIVDYLRKPWFEPKDIVNR